MSKDFEKALEFLFVAEGGYSNNKYDKGGKTNLGVTQATYNHYLKNLGQNTRDVRSITHGNVD